ncbi:MAG: hypothetical protein HQ503_09230 [Rhodospirillales bacterium]|nr:hypothetical protein [Rhodospirillales bacterium]
MSDKQYWVQVRTLVPIYGHHRIEAKSKKDAMKQAKQMVKELSPDDLFNLERGGEEGIGGTYVSCDEDGEEFEFHLK